MFARNHGESYEMENIGEGENTQRKRTYKAPWLDTKNTTRQDARPIENLGVLGVSDHYSTQ